MLSQSNVIKSLLAITAWREAGHLGGHLSSEIVAWCIANRVRRGFGNWTEVLENIPQYRASDDPLLTTLPNLWEPGFIRLLQDIDHIYDNVGPDLSNGGVYWAETNKSVNEWFKANVINTTEHKRCASMNALVVWN
jgi:hypothetical protein